MNTRKGYGTKIYDIHLKVGQKTRDKLDQALEKYNLSQSKAIRWAVLHADFSEYNSDDNTNDDAAPADVNATDLAARRYDQEELLTLQAIVKVLTSLKKDYHRTGGNLNQIAHNMNYARQHGDLHFTEDDVKSVREQREQIREKYEDISSLIGYLEEELCNKQ